MSEEQKKRLTWHSTPAAEMDYMAFRVDDRVVLLHRSEGDEWIDQDGNVWDLDQEE